MASSPGTLIVIGGALQPDSDVVWQRVVDEAGGAGARVAVFPTAAYEPERVAAQIVAALERCGAQAEIIPVAPHLAGVDLRAALADPALIARVAASQAVFFSGGAQEYIVDTLQPGGRPTAMLDAIRGVLAGGGVIAGTSAGAAAMSRMMFRDAMDSLAVLKGQWRAGQEYDRGLGFVDADLLIDQHFLKRGRIGRLLPALQRLGWRLGLGVDENAAVVMRGTQLEVIGGSGAVLVDLGVATSDPTLPAFNVSGARLTYLDSGDRHDLVTGETAPAARKRQRVDPGAPRATLPVERYFLDMLGDGSLRAALQQLLEGPSGEVFGLACRARPQPGDRLPDIGFEFRLRRGPGLVGCCSGGAAGGDCTVLGAWLDVVPVRIATPLFTPLRGTSSG